mgnify:CR=1 FL=1
MGASECEICEENEYLTEYGIEGHLLYVCGHCVDAALAVYAREYGVIP